MGLSPVLFVGLGGTGGKVLGAVRHHLLRELNNAGVREIPQGWQFLHIDVPAERDAEEEGKPFTLPQDAYRPLTGVGDSYSGAYGQLSAALPPRSASPGRTAPRRLDVVGPCPARAGSCAHRQGSGPTPRRRTRCRADGAAADRARDRLRRPEATPDRQRFVRDGRCTRCARSPGHWAASRLRGRLHERRIGKRNTHRGL